MANKDLNIIVLEHPEKEYVILHVIKEEYINTTLAGKPKFCVKPVANKIEELGYKTNGYQVSNILRNAEINGKKVFEQDDSSKAGKYIVHDHSLFMKFYNEARVAYMFPLFINSEF